MARMGHLPTADSPLLICEGEASEILIASCTNDAMGSIGDSAVFI